jgi:hypothetical protein
MNSWFNNCSAMTVPLAVRLVRSPASIVVTIILLGSAALPQSVPNTGEVPANELARKVVTNELKFQDEDHGYWMYRQEKEEFGKREVKDVIETKDGALSRLLSIDGHPVTAKQQQKEDQRIQKLVSSPEEQRKLQRARNMEMEPGKQLFKMLPDAFVFNYAGHEGDLIKLSFRPNPTFQPPSREARVFHDMEGEMWIDEKQQRLAALNGHLMEDVKFGGGLLGHLNKGGKFGVIQAEVAPGHWDMTVMGVDMKGKVLLFKTISVQQTENRSDFHRMPNDLTMAQAADLLNRKMVAVSNR